jgi:hypothetical protein
VAPAGGGILTDFGRDQSEDPLSGGGNGGLLHGLVRLPSWARVGGDVRLAGLANAPGRAEGVEWLAFPMQADLSARLGTDVISAVASVGLRAVPRQPEVNSGSVARSRAVPILSREHYVIFRPEKTPYYVRGGRFFPPYGLRLADHTTYIRRHLGFDLEEEPYGVSAGAVDEGWEAHATGYVKDPLHAGGPGELGAAALGELRVGIAALGLSGRAGFTAVGRRLEAGPYGKVWLEDLKLLMMAEVDGVHQRFSGVPGAPSRVQLATYLGPVWIPLRGLSVGAAYQAFVEDASVAGTARQAVDVWASWLPISHVEVMLSARTQGIGTTRAWNAMLQLHYFL